MGQLFMTLRDLWEVLTLQTSWADANIFIVIGAVWIYLLFAGLVLIVFAAIGEIVEGISEITNKKTLEKYRDMTPEERAKENKANRTGFLILIGLFALAIISNSF
tara:strand:- start:558 stop:872 length:315 start_codon:yes stop_codon:yes gene_type:complete